MIDYGDIPDRRPLDPDDVEQYVEPDEDLEYEIHRQQEIDDAIEAGEHLRDKRREDALLDTLEDIGRTLANEELEKQHWWHQQNQDEQWIEEHGEPDYPYK